MTFGEYLGFVAVAVVLAVTPGPDTLLSLRYAIARRGSGVAAASGSSAAIFVWAGLTAAGVAAVLQASELAYQVLCVVGGGYLAFLGARAILLVRRRAAAATTADPGGQALAVPSGSLQARAAFGSGVLTCLTNPKTGLFFLALFPQFTPPGAQPVFVLVVLGGTVASVVHAYLLCLVFVADAANRWLARPRVTRTIETASGLILIGLGALTLIPAVPALQAALHA